MSFQELFFYGEFSVSNSNLSFREERPFQLSFLTKLGQDLTRLRRISPFIVSTPFNKKASNKQLETSSDDDSDVASQLSGVSIIGTPSKAAAKVPLPSTSRSVSPDGAKGGRNPVPTSNWADDWEDDDLKDFKFPQI